MKKIITGIALAVFSLSMTACMETTVKSHVDPNYASTKIQSVIVDLSGMPSKLQYDMEEKIAENFQEKGIKYININNILLPTRNYSDEEKIIEIKRSGYQTILTMNHVDSDKDIMITGSYTWGNANAYAYGRNAYGNSQSFTTPIGRANGIDVFKATLFDTNNFNTVWTGDIITKAQGTAFVGNTNHIVNSASEGLVLKLTEDKLI